MHYNSPSVQPPYNVGWEGVFIPPTLLLHSKNAPPISSEVSRLQWGYSVILQGRTVRIGHSYPDHMFHDARRPSVMTFAGLCGPSPSSFITSASPTTPRRFWTSPSRPSVITFARLRRASPSSSSTPRYLPTPKVLDVTFGHRTSTSVVGLRHLGLVVLPAFHKPNGGEMALDG